LGLFHQKRIRLFGLSGKWSSGDTFVVAVEAARATTGPDWGLAYTISETAIEPEIDSMTAQPVAGALCCSKEGMFICFDHFGQLNFIDTSTGAVRRPGGPRLYFPEWTLFHQQTYSVKALLTVKAGVL
jgi:hypothetical protein